MATSGAAWRMGSSLSRQSSTSSSSRLGVYRRPAGDDAALVEQLRAGHFEARLAAFTRLRHRAHADAAWFSRFECKQQLFGAFGRVLADANWELQHQCVKLLADTLPHYGDDVEWCFNSILPVLAAKLGSTKITVRRAALHTLLRYVRQWPAGTLAVQKAVVAEALHGEAAAVDEALRELPGLFAHDLAERDWSPLVDGLTRLALDAEPLTTDLALVALERLLGLVGQAAFNQLVQTISAEQRDNYEALLVQRGRVNAQRPNRLPAAAHADWSASPTVGDGPAAKQSRCGIIPIAVWDQLSREGEPKIRVAGLEELKQIIDGLTPTDVNRLLPHVFSYLNMISNILDDLNFKVVVLTLDVLRVTVGKLRRNAEPHLQHIVSTLSKHLGNQKLVVKQLNMMTLVDLMQHLEPKPVVAALNTHLQNRNSRVREEVLNVLTVALIKFSSAAFNLSAIAHVLCPLLADPKRRARLAAFELLAVLAAAMGAGRLEPLLRAVRDAEQRQRAAGLLAAVQARLGRGGQLARVRYDGLVEYAASTPAMERGVAADIDWIMAAAVGPGSAVSRALSAHGAPRLGPATQPAPPAPSTPDDGAAPRRMPSASRNSRRLPWEAVAAVSPPPPPSPPLVELRQNSAPPTTDGRTETEGAATAISSGRTSVPPLPRRSPPNALPGKRVLSPIASDRHSNSNGFNLTTTTLLEEDLGTSLDRVKFNAVRRKELAVGSPRGRPEKSHSDNGLSRDELWDERPIKPAKSNGTVSMPPQMRSDGLLNRSVPHHDDSPLDLVPDTHNTFEVNGSPRKQPPPKKAAKPKPKPPPAKPSNAPAARARLPPKPPAAESTSRNPEHALAAALKKIASDEWTDKVEGITTVQRLTQTAPTAVAADLHAVVVALMAEAKNLRTSVSRQAIVCFGHLFVQLRKQMDPEIDKVAGVLMQKTGDVSSAFIRDDSVQALEMMVDHATPARACAAVIATGAPCKSSTIRSACAQLLQRIVDNEGAAKALGQRDVGDRLLPQAFAFATDQQPAARFYGKATLQALAREPSAFDAALRRVFSDSQARAVRDLVVCVNAKGLGETPSQGATPAGSGHQSASLQRNGSIRRGGSTKKLPEELQDKLESVRAGLLSNNWEERLRAVVEFEKLCKSQVKAVAADMRTAEAFAGRLSDTNNKVASQAASSLLAAMPRLGPHLADSAMRSVASNLVKGLMAQLPSKNDELRQLACAGLDACVRHIDNSFLIMPFAMATRSGNVKQKPEMLPRLGKICEQAHTGKGKSVELHALPVLWDLLKTQQGDSGLRQATAHFAHSLGKTVGKRTLLDLATPLNPQQRADLQSML